MNMELCILCGQRRQTGLIIRRQAICQRCLGRMLRREGACLSLQRRRRLCRLYG